MRLQRVPTDQLGEGMPMAAQNVFLKRNISLERFLKRSILLEREDTFLP
jgi:hypothetical protein